MFLQEEVGRTCADFCAELERDLEALAVAGCLRYAVSAHSVFSLLTKRLSIESALGRVREELRAMEQDSTVEQGHYSEAQEVRKEWLLAMEDVIRLWESQAAATTAGETAGPTGGETAGGTAAGTAGAGSPDLTLGLTPPSGSQLWALHWQQGLSHKRNAAMGK